MGKYTEDSRELLELVGGKDNIAAVSHCMTRMRFVLGDPKKADVKCIEAMKAVKGSFTQAGQFQVIIGNTVAEFYKDFMDVAGIEGVSKDDFTAFLDGEVISLKEVGDGVFSEGIVGEGLAIRPISETLCAPVSGKIMMLMEDSRHAVGMTLSNGVEILLHVGIDTVDMQGDGFSYLVHTGDEVKTGTPLLTFSREKIKAAGHPDVTICVITNKNGGETFAFHTGMTGKTGETVIASF